MRFYKLELVNREESYNKTFGRSPQVGVMQVVKPKPVPTGSGRQGSVRCRHVPADIEPPASVGALQQKRETDARLPRPRPLLAPLPRRGRRPLVGRQAGECAEAVGARGGGSSWGMEGGVGPLLPRSLSGIPRLAPQLPTHQVCCQGVCASPRSAPALRCEAGGDADRAGPWVGRSPSRW